MISCAERSEGEISIRWKEGRAVGLSIPSDLFDNPTLDQLSVRLAKQGNEVPVLGEFLEIGGEIVFTPLVPLTRGLGYEVLHGDAVIGTIAVPELNQGEARLAVADIYPTQDTLPENQLKFFLKFSNPMQEGGSRDFVTLLNSDNDTLKNIFLDLQPELWNADQTMLTLWLDPGRIKRDLIPNLEMGAPLAKDNSYRLVISDQWKGKFGGKLNEVYTKNFVVAMRDSISPDPASWVLKMPKSGTEQALSLDFLEALDYSLLQVVFKIRDNQNRQIQGKWEIGFEEKNSQFTPESPWERGKYIIEIESRLEDLAGNNLNRLFETDLLTQSKTSAASDFKRLEFEIKE